MNRKLKLVILLMRKNIGNEIFGCLPKEAIDEINNTRIPINNIKDKRVRI